jgi:outer membrane protein assembly factor BamD
MRFVKVIGILTLVSLMSACSFFGGEKTEEPDVPEQQLYSEALEALEAQNYSLAVEKLQRLEARYPFGRFSEQAQLELIFAYFKNYEPEAARAAADRFVRLHPNHENIDYAYYLKGLTSFEEDRSLVSRYLPIDETQRDPGAALESFESFATLTTRYPNSQYAPDALKRMQYLKNRLAEYEVHVALYYMKRSAWVAAANRGRYVVENLQETPAVPEALGIMAEAYEELGLNDQAARAAEVLRTNFPDFRYTSTKERDKSLLETATFGLLGSSDETPVQRPNSVVVTEKDAETTEDAERSWFSILTFGVFDSTDEEEATPAQP